MDNQILPNEILLMIAMCGWRVYCSMRLINHGFRNELAFGRHLDNFKAIRVGKVSYLRPLIVEYYRLTIVNGNDISIFRGGKLVKNIVYSIPRGYGIDYLWELQEVIRTHYEGKHTYEEIVKFAYGRAIRATWSMKIE
jgi:hypothetical protein